MLKKNFFERRLSFFVRYIKTYFRKGRFTPQVIPAISIETTNFCDAKCVFCANTVMKRHREHLDMSVFKKVVDEFVAMGGTVIDFCTTIGEPLLDPYLLQRARYVRNLPQFSHLGFVTNLEWLHKFDLEEFLDSGITWLAISTILSGRQKYLEFFSVDRYEQTLKNLLKLIQENNKRKDKINLVFSIKPTNESIKDVINHSDFKMVNSLVDSDLIKKVKNQGCVDDWIGYVNLPSYLKKRPLYPRLFRPCALLYTKLIIFSNGNIGACTCRDFEANSELILGNAKYVTLKEVWSGEKLFHLRYDWRKKNKIPNICRSCTHYLY